MLRVTLRSEEGPDGPSAPELVQAPGAGRADAAWRHFQCPADLLVGSPGFRVQQDQKVALARGEFGQAVPNCVVPFHTQQVIVDTHPLVGAPQGKPEANTRRASCFAVVLIHPGRARVSRKRVRFSNNRSHTTWLTSSASLRDNRYRRVTESTSGEYRLTSAFHALPSPFLAATINSTRPHLVTIGSVGCGATDDSGSGSGSMYMGVSPSDSQTAPGN